MALNIDSDIQLLAELFDQGELHPFDARDAYNWTTSKASRMLDIPLKTLECYNPTIAPRRRRNPSETTKQKVYARVKAFIRAGILPRYPDKLPQSLQKLIPALGATG